MQFNRFAAGKKVYSQGSHAPTRGTVNPTGYIKRELKKRGVQTNAATQRKSINEQIQARNELGRRLIGK